MSNRSDKSERSARRALLGVVLLAIALAATGCGGEDDDRATSSSQPAVASPAGDASASAPGDAEAAAKPDRRSRAARRAQRRAAAARRSRAAAEELESLPPRRRKQRIIARGRPDQSGAVAVGPRRKRAAGRPAATAVPAEPRHDAPAPAPVPEPGETTNRNPAFDAGVID